MMEQENVNVIGLNIYQLKDFCECIGEGYLGKNSRPGIQTDALPLSYTNSPGFFVCLFFKLNSIF